MRHLLPLLAALLAALAPGCGKPQARTAEVEHPEGRRYNALVWHFLTATDLYDRALWVHDGSELREEMERFYAGRPRADWVRIVDVEARGDAVEVTAQVVYADGTDGRVPVVVRKGDPAWLVDWRATREAGVCRE